MHFRVSAQFAFALFASLASNLSGAVLEWDRTEVKIEMAPDQAEARAIFTVTNRGDEAVRIARVKTSCGCTGSIIDRKIIEPGGSTRITGTFNKGKRNGTNHNKLEVFTDSQPDAVATLHMVVKIPTLVGAQPGIVYWKPGSNTTERSIRITLDERYVDSISEIEYDASRITVVEEPDPSGKVDRILKVVPKSFEALLRDTIVIRAEGEDGQIGEARVHVFVQP